jgi:ureidoglycolate amidohydrolase
VQLRVESDRLFAELAQLATFSDAPAPAVTRVLFTPPDMAAREYFTRLCTAAGLAVRVDAVGNLFARWQGADPALPAVATGSHTDAIPHSGMYDGTVGVLGGLEAIRALQRAGFKPRRSIELIMFTSEEPTRFGLGCLGSRLLGGQLTPDRAAALVDDQGQDLESIRRDAGCSGTLADVRLAPGHYAQFVELHIEQGPLLERANLPIGVVTALAAPATLRVRYQGPGGHAGGVYMPDRHDPLLAASQFMLEVEAAAINLGGAESVATVGRLQVHPGLVNSIARDVLMEVDVRDIDRDRRDRVFAHIRRAADECGAGRQVTTTVEEINADPPTICDPAIIAAVEAAAAEAGLAHQLMISRAYHDTTFMSLVAPVGMIFIPCRNGVSHHPDEYAAPQAIAAGAEVLARTLMRLASE